MSISSSLLKIILEANIDAYITPMSDEHLNEFVGESDNRVKFLTGFTGTTAIVYTSKTKSCILLDDRYFPAAPHDLNGYEKKNATLEDFHTQQFLEGIRTIGIDPHFISAQEYLKLKQRLKKKKIKLVPVEEDLVGKIWTNQSSKTPKPLIDLEEYQYEQLGNEVKLHNIKNNKLVGSLILSGDEKEEENNARYSIVGLNRIEKLDKATKILKNTRTFDYFLITELDTIAWLLNLRGHDIQHNQVFYAYLSISKTETILFTDSDVKLPNIEQKPYNDFQHYLKEISNKKVLVSNMCNAFIAKSIVKNFTNCKNLQNIRNFKLTDELRKEQSLKTKIEITGLKYAYMSDAVILSELYQWIFTARNVTERGIANKFKELSKKMPGHITTSFEPIVGIGSDSANMHNSNNNKKYNKGDMVLIDSGNHYLFGTTDITRTLCEEPNEEQKEQYTLVLKAVLAAKRHSAKRITSDKIDKKTREILKAHGIQYGTATGHGIGIVVHESPPTIDESKNEKILQNQVFTIEPGSYNDGQYGIRIEDTVVAVKSSGKVVLKNIAYVPLHMALISPTLLNKQEQQYINNYNKATQNKLKEYLKKTNNDTALKYLIENTTKFEIKPNTAAKHKKRKVIHRTGKLFKTLTRNQNKKKEHLKTTKPFVKP